MKHAALHILYNCMYIDKDIQFFFTLNNKISIITIIL